MNTRDFLDAVKRRHGLASDYKLAQLLRWNPRRVSMYRTTARELDETGCIAIADALDLPRGYVLAEIAAARAKDEGARREWLRVARLLKAGSKAAAACVLAGVLVGANDARAASPGRAIFNCADYTLRALRRRRILRRAAFAIRAFCDALACSIFPHFVI